VDHLLHYSKGHEKNGAGKPRSISEEFLSNHGFA